MAADGELVLLVVVSTSVLDSGTRLRVTIGSSAFGTSLFSKVSRRPEVSDVGLTIAERERDMLVGNGAFPSRERSTKLVGLEFFSFGNSRDSVIPEEPTGVRLEVDFSSRLMEPLAIGAGGLERGLAPGVTGVETVERILLLAPG